MEYYIQVVVAKKIIMLHTLLYEFQMFEYTQN
jgi:hypothetical protein